MRSGRSKPLQSQFYRRAHDRALEVVRQALRSLERIGSVADAVFKQIAAARVLEGLVLKACRTKKTKEQLEAWKHVSARAGP